MTPLSHIRNFCIIAHIDHGKSTLADRLLMLTGTVTAREMKHAQLLDSMDLEQEKGITIKLAPVRMQYEFENQRYQLNLIDTPGHVDFSYEVSRSLAAVEGALLVVDATQGIQAQTLANAYLAMEHDLTIIPLLNKIDLPAAEIERSCMELEHTLGIKRSDILMISAKTGQHVPELLAEIVKRIPHPQSKSESEMKAIVFDSVYDSYKGVVAYVRVFTGGIKRGDRLKFLNAKREIEVLEVGLFKPAAYQTCDSLSAGEIGYVVTGVKSVSEARVGDTLWQGSEQNPAPLPGYRKVTPYVYAGLFPTDAAAYPIFRDALLRLSLNDASLFFEPEQSNALGHGYRCGFLGLLHMEIVQERLEREFDLDLIVTSPSVSYEVIMNSGETTVIANPSQLPDPSQFTAIREPWMKVDIILPREYMGKIITLCDERRGVQKNIEYIDNNRAMLRYELPLAEIILDFYDILKSLTAGFASMNYEYLEYRESELVKLDMLVAGDRIEALAHIIFRPSAYRIGSALCKRLKELIPRASFEIVIQAAIGSKIISRESISALRKNVTAKLYGGDRTRKDKLLKKQKAGKKRMKKFGKVTIPQDAFLALLKRDNQ